MTWAPQEAQKTVYEILELDLVLSGLVTGVFDSASVPQDAEFPYITIDPGSFGDRSSHTHRGFSTEMTIHVWDQSENLGRKRVQKIQKEVDRLLHTVNICIEGWNIISLRQSLCETFLDSDNITIHGVQRFKLLLGEA